MRALYAKKSTQLSGENFSNIFLNVLWNIKRREREIKLDEIFQYDIKSSKQKLQIIF